MLRIGNVVLVMTPLLQESINEGRPFICDGCNVHEPHPHSCHHDSARFKDEPITFRVYYGEADMKIFRTDPAGSPHQILTMESELIESTLIRISCQCYPCNDPGKDEKVKLFTECEELRKIVKELCEVI